MAYLVFTKEDVMIELLLIQGQATYSVKSQRNAAKGLLSSQEGPYSIS